MTRVWMVAAWIGMTVACVRPSSDYDVHVYGQGTEIDMILPAPEPMGGRIELARVRLWGTNLGYGITGVFGDVPRADGAAFVFGNAEFGYPLDPALGRNATILRPGPPLVSPQDACFTRGFASEVFGLYEYVDVGDRIDLVMDGGDVLTLPRDPAVHPRPSGESWYIGYGQKTLPVIQDHPLLPDTWRNNATWGIRAPGTILPPESTPGMVPFPITGQVMHTPPEVAGLRVAGRRVRAPTHGYDARGVFVGDDVEDDVRSPGPWTRPVRITWTPSEEGTPLTVAVRFLGALQEGTCGCDADCEAGFVCGEDEMCRSTEGVLGQPLGEVVCTVHDDGAFSLRPEHLEGLERWVSDEDRQGAVLMVGRITEGTITVPDAMTFNGKRTPLTPVRTRATDLVITRLEAP